ncbi:MAG: hypothetical protein RLZZ458_3019, partial [Planctomycetota bacterium]|jgi:hypothetical protein
VFFSFMRVCGLLAMLAVVLRFPGRAGQLQLFLFAQTPFLT